MLQDSSGAMSQSIGVMLDIVPRATEQIGPKWFQSLSITPDLEVPGAPRNAKAVR